MDFGLEIQKTNVGIRISILEIPFVPIFKQKNNLDFFRPNLPKNGFWGWNFKNLSLDLESAPPIYHMCQFSVKMEKLPNYVRYFGSNNVEGVAESWLEAEMSWVEVEIS